MKNSIKKLLILGFIAGATNLAYAASEKDDPSDTASYSVRLCNYLNRSVTFGLKKTGGTENKLKLLTNPVDVKPNECQMAAFRVRFEHYNGGINHFLNLDVSGNTYEIKNLKVTGIVNYKHEMRITGTSPLYIYSHYDSTPPEDRVKNVTEAQTNPFYNLNKGVVADYALCTAPDLKTAKEKCRDA